MPLTPAAWVVSADLTKIVCKTNRKEMNKRINFFQALHSS